MSMSRAAATVAPRAAGAAIMAIAAACSLALVVSRLGVVPSLALLLVLFTVGVMFVRPELATLLVAFLLYVNFPAVLTRQHNMPPVVAGSFIVLLALPLLDALIVRRKRLTVDTTCGLILAFVACALVSTLGAVDVGVALGRIQQHVSEGLVLYWLILNAVRDLSTVRNVLWTVLLAASLLATLSLYQTVTGAYAQDFGGLAYRYDRSADAGRAGDALDAEAGAKGPADDDAGVESGYGRARGPVDEPNRFAQVLAVLLPLAAFLYRTPQSRFGHLSAAALGALTLTGVALSESRGAMVTLVVVACAMLLVRWIRGRHVLALLAGGFALVTILSLLSPSLQERVWSIANARYVLAKNESRQQEADAAMRGRATEMLAALHVFLDYPLLGVGPGQFPPFYFREYARRTGVTLRQIDVPRRAHDLYLELGAEYGVLGLGAFVAIVVLVMRRLWRARRQWLGRDRGAADLVTALWLSLFTYLCTGVFLHLAYERYYWFLLALAGASLRILASHARGAHADTDRGVPAKIVRAA
jgi:putative inorganic carbon (hco3(-)) transporter